MFSLTVIASTGDRFSGFAPYVASVNDAGTVAFQAALHGGGSGVFIGDGEEVGEVVGPARLAAVTSHPDLNNAGEVSFYGELRGGGQGVFLHRRGGLHTVAETNGAFASIGPLGPTMNETGTVAFRAEPAPGVSGVYAGGDDGVAAIADTNGPWAQFHGLPVITADGTVLFRADRKDGVEGIYAGRRGSTAAIAETGERFASLGLFPSAGDQGTVAFAATLRGGGAGIFTTEEDGQVAAIIHTDGAYESCRGALITNAGGVIGIATPRGESLGLFAGPDPETDRVFAVGAPLLGSVVAEFAANPVSVNTTGQVAIRATLADGSQVVLRVDPGS
jgi:hypothetical protein